MKRPRIRWSEEDNAFIGNLSFCGDCCHGDSKKEVEDQLKDILESNLESSSIIDLVKSVRILRGESRRIFSELLQIPLKTYEKWERGERNPPAGSLLLLELIVTDTDRVLEDLGRIKKMRENHEGLRREKVSLA